jgi:hypothetical protein
MKPLSIALFTIEDLTIWHTVDARFPAGQLHLLRSSRASDRRDAALMFQSQNHPIVTGHYIDGGEHILVRGINGNPAAAYAHRARYST